MSSNYLLRLTILAILTATLVIWAQPVLAATSTTTGNNITGNNTPADVTSSHWAYKAVKLLIDKGYLQLYQDQTFQGDRPVDRYTLASIVAKILIDSASGQTGINKDDLSILKSLINEFHAELITVIAQNNGQDKRLDGLEQQDVITNQELIEARAELLKLQNEVAQLKTQLQALETELKDTKEKYRWYIIGAAIIGFLGVLI
ncbi:MAG TPA: S-layer homology domain-containing protein [Bacillota bacterium]|nr:S-layer homology domain-containing protein [Bacillota bacterium]